MNMDLFENKNRNTELISVFPYKEGDKWFFRLIYEVKDIKTGEIKNIIIPKCMNPFSVEFLSLEYRENEIKLGGDPYWYRSPTLEKFTSCYLVNEYCKLPMLLANDDSIRGCDPFYYGEVIIKPAVK